MRSPSEILTDLSALFAAAAEQCVPLNLHTAVQLLAEHASALAEQAVPDVSALAARVDTLETLLTESGITIPAPAPAPAPSTTGVLVQLARKVPAPAPAPSTSTSTDPNAPTL
jgi:hypothetical protein